MQIAGNYLWNKLWNLLGVNATDSVDHPSWIFGIRGIDRRRDRPYHIAFFGGRLASAVDRD